MATYNTKQLIEYFSAQMPVSERGKVLPFEYEDINQLVLDSRQVKKKTLFVALKGANYDGREFIPKAIESGAVAILAETDDMGKNGIITCLFANNKKIPQITVYKLAEKLSEFAGEFYGEPSKEMLVVGVTGTNGKTTVTQLIAQWADLINEKSAVLGTIGNGELGKLTPAINTTPSAVDTQGYLANFLSKKVKLVAMEVSSHGLALGRVKGVDFAATVFTNLSRDHLDFHRTMTKYEQAKWSLFSPLANKLAVKSSGKKIINYDDKVGKRWIDKSDDAIIVSTLPKNLKTIRQLGKPYVGVHKIVYHNKGTSIYFDSSFGRGELESRLFGEFNVSNLLLAFCTLLALGFPFYVLVNTAYHLQPVIGRMEIFKEKNKPTVIVDYAHTPDALDKALSAAKEHCTGALWVIFGCGGDRDKGKRPLMAKVAHSYSSHIIITNDNPRTEDAKMIINDIMAGFSETKSIKVIQDRKKAIQWAVNHGDENDIILVAGKGHEEYQIIGQKKYRYSDRKVVSQLLGITL